MANVTVADVLHARGLCGLHLLNSHHLLFERCKFRSGDIAPVLPDEHGKCLLLDKCHHITIRRCKCVSPTPAGDGINIFASHHITVEDTLISGKRRDDDHDIAVAIVVDEGSYNVVLRRIRFGTDREHGSLAARTITIVGRDVLVEHITTLGRVQVGLDERPVNVGRIILRRVRPSQVAVSPLVKGIVVASDIPLSPGWGWTT